jgi:hypothetical protein
MLKAYANIYLGAIERMAYIERICRQREADGKGRDFVGKPNAETIRHELDIVAKHARMAQLSEVANEAAQTRHWITDEAVYADVAELIASVQKSLRTALSRLLLLPVDGSVAHYYESPYTGWRGVIDAFPETQYDIQEAGRALALGLSTACMFHVMRVAELGLHAVGRQLRVRLKRGKTLEDADWVMVLDAIGTKLNALRSNAQPKQKQGKPPRLDKSRGAKLQWYAQMRAEMGAVKDAWRNQVAHPHKQYNEYEARGVYEHVRTLMERVAAGPPK